MLNLDFTQITISCITAAVCIFEIMLKYGKKMNDEEKENNSNNDIYDILNRGIKNSVGGRSLLNHPIFTRKHLLNSVITEIKDDNIGREELFREIFASLYEYLYGHLENLVKNIENDMYYDVMNLNRDVIKAISDALIVFEKDEIKFSKKDIPATDIVKKELIQIIKSQLIDLDSICFQSLQTIVHISCDNCKCKLMTLNDILFVLHMYFIMLENVIKYVIKDNELLDELKGLSFHDTEL